MRLTITTCPPSLYLPGLHLCLHGPQGPLFYRVGACFSHMRFHVPDHVMLRDRDSFWKNEAGPHSTLYMGWEMGREATVITEVNSCSLGTCEGRHSLSLSVLLCEIGVIVCAHGLSEVMCCNSGLERRAEQRLWGTSCCVTLRKIKPPEPQVCDICQPAL